MIMTNAFDNRTNDKTPSFLIGLDSGVVFFATIDLGYLFKIDVALFVSEQICNQILTPNTSIADACKDGASNFEFGLRDAFHHFEWHFIDGIKVKQIFLQGSVGEAWEDILWIFFHFLPWLVRQLQML